MILTRRQCPDCNSENIKRHCRYAIKNDEARTLFLSQDCGNYFSETKNTPLAGISLVLEAINDGLGLNAACRTFHVEKTPSNEDEPVGWLERDLIVVCLVSSVYPTAD